MKTEREEPLSRPTPYADVNAVLCDLLSGVQTILGRHLVGMYLDGSLAMGDFDASSDIDFVVVTDEKVGDDLFSALRAMHDRIATLDSKWALHLEGSYISQQALERYDPAQALHPNIEWGKGERLKMVQHDEAWQTHRYVLREHGITLMGPSPRTLIAPVSPDDLRQAMLCVLRRWAAPILDDPRPTKYRGYQSYIVLSLCRILYTLEYGTVVSKRVAARWARESLGERWVPLIESAWVGRDNPEPAASLEDVNGTLDFIRYALALSEKYGGMRNED